MNPFPRWVSFVRGLGVGTDRPGAAADETPEASSGPEDLSMPDHPAVDLRALDREISGRLARARRRNEHDR